MLINFNNSHTSRASFLSKKDLALNSTSKACEKSKTYKVYANSKYISTNNVAEKVHSTKNELLNLRKEDNFVCDFESKRLINRNNLSAFSPKKSEDYRKFITDTLGIFKSHKEKINNNNDALANRIFNRNKSPLKGETGTLTSTFKKQNKSELMNSKMNLLSNKSKHIFAERRNEIMNLINTKPGETERINSLSPKTRVASNKKVGQETTLDQMIEKKPALSLKQMDTNLKYSKIDFCTYYSSKPKIIKSSNLNNYNFTSTQNKIAKIISKHC